MITATACSSDDVSVSPDSLASLTSSIPFQTGTVIACASGSQNPNEVIAYVYPRPGVRDLRFFETNDATVDALDYSNYQEIDVVPQDFFNGYLNSIVREVSQEKWLILTFMEGDTLQLSNPIRLKHKSQNTIFTDDITITSAVQTMPEFNWEQNVQPSDAIYFQVVSNSSNDLLSGTYTIEPQFQYYNTQNVVLNITRDLPPPALIEGLNYGITVMGVSEDNWVNFLVSRSFLVDK